jgi:Domain of unknown function (DUF4288)
MTKWFTAVMVRGSFVDGEADDERFGDLLYRLIEAADAEAAYAKAMRLGAQAAESYQNGGESCRLQFLGLADLTEVRAERLEDGVEVYSQLIEKRPSEMVAEKETLSAFEADEETLPVPPESSAIEPR